MTRRGRPPSHARPGLRPPNPPSEPSTSSVRGSLKSFATVFAPATLLAALLLYVGWVRTRAYYGYFGISSIQLGYAPQDYALRSADVGLGAVVIVALAGGVLLVLDRIVIRLLYRVRDRPISGAINACVAFVGSALVLIGLFNVTAEASFAALPPLSSACLVAAGAVLLLRFGAGSPGHPAFLGPATVAFGLMIIGLTGFWAANSYAQGIGVAAAMTVDADASTLPVVTILSDEPLDVPGSLVTASRIPTIEGKWTYRYVGARLLVYANDRWFLIVTARQHGYRSTIVTLHDADNLRIETTTPGSESP